MRSISPFTRLAVLALMLFTLFVFAAPVFAAPLVFGPARAVDWPSLLSILVATYQPYVITLIGLILLDVLLGVASGLKAKAFQWQKLADFYSCTVVPGLLGWIGFTIATYLVMPDLLGASRDLISQGVATVAWATVVASLAASIGASAKELYGIQIPLARP